MINREKYDEQIEKMKKIASKYEKDEFRKIVEEIEVKKKYFNVNVLFVGHFSAGKSALLNKLVEKDDFLKEDQLAQTAIATELHFGKEKIVTVSQDGEKKEVSNWSMVDNSRDFCVEVFCEADNLKKLSDFTIVDTPGFDSGIENHNKALTSYLGTGSAYVLVIDAEKGGIDEISLTFLKELGKYSNQVAILINKCDKQIPDNVIRIKEAAENTLAMFGLDYSVYCVSKFDVGIGNTLVDIINGFSAQMAFDYKIEHLIANGAMIMINTINILQEKLFLDTFELDDAIHKYEMMEKTLKESFDCKRAQIKDDYENATDNIMDEVEGALNASSDAIADAVLNGGEVAVNAIIMEAIRPVLVNSFKNLAMTQVDEVVSLIDLSMFNTLEEKESLDRIFESLSNKLKENIQDGNFYKMSDESEELGNAEIDKKNDKEKMSNNKLYHIITGIGALLDGILVPEELIIVFLPEIIKLFKGLFGESEREKIKKKYRAVIIPQVKSKLRNPIEKAAYDSQEKIIEEMQNILEEQIGSIKNELEKLKIKKEKKTDDFGKDKKMYKEDIEKLRVYTMIGEE